MIVLMGSGAETADETVDWLIARGREGRRAASVRLYRPFSIARLPRRAAAARCGPSPCSTAPRSRARSASRSTWTCVAALREAREDGLPRAATRASSAAATACRPRSSRRRWSRRSSTSWRKDRPKNHFTVGIVDDVTHLSLPYDADFDIEPDDVVRAVFFGLGADGTVGANKNSIKIIGEETDNYAQGYFVYDSKKSGAMTVSHLRFGPRPIRSAYLIRRANFVACHQFEFLEKLRHAGAGRARRASSCSTPPTAPDEVWDHLPREVQEQIIEKRLRFYVIDAYDGGPRGGHGRAHQHHHADLLLRHLRRAAARGGDRRRSRRRSRRPTARRATRWCGGTSPPSTHTLAHLHEVPVPAAATLDAPPAAGRARRGARTSSSG